MKFNREIFLQKLNQNLQERYERLYGGRDCSVNIRKVQKELYTKLCMILIIFGILCGFSFFGGQGDVSKKLKINEKGKLVSAKRPTGKEKTLQFTARVRIEGKDEFIEKEVPLIIEPYGVKKKETEIPGVEEDRTRSLERELQQILSGINEDTGNKQVTFPAALKNGERITWEQTDTSNIPILLVALVLVLLWLYKSRFSMVKKEERLAKQSIIRELPEFINRLVLLLNAGMVLQSAYTKIVQDRKEVNTNTSYFYEQMDLICKKMKETNGSLHKSLLEFAKRSGVRELLLVSNIIADNMSKGTDLVDKLQKESRLLWFSRKQQSEEKGRLAESKLTMPLVLLLLVLIMVTITPALMEM